jgi:predicted nucleic acid-binding Zn ribbon protein
MKRRKQELNPGEWVPIIGPGVGPESHAEPRAPDPGPVPPARSGWTAQRGSAAPVDLSAHTPPMLPSGPPPVRVTAERMSVTPGPDRTATGRNPGESGRSREITPRVTPPPEQRTDPGPVTAVRRIQREAGRPVSVRPIVESSTVIPPTIESKFLQYVNPKRVCVSCGNELSEGASKDTITCSNACRQRMYRDNKRQRDTARNIAKAVRLKRKLS